MEKESMGTTLLAIQCTDGVVIASDSRTSSGVYIASRGTNKITQIAPTIFFARSGGAADTQALSKYVKYFLNVLAMNSETPFSRSVTICANVLKKLIHSNKDRLSAGILCAGYDETDGPSVWSVDPTGLALKRKFATSGSGSVYITAYCDENFREDFNVEQATKFAINAVTGAIVRDGSSGGVVNIVQVKSDGSKRLIIKPNQQPFNYSVVST